MNLAKSSRRGRLSSKAEFAYITKGADIPDGGWTMRTFLSSLGRKLILDIVAVKRAATVRGIRALSSFLLTHFRTQVDKVINGAAKNAPHHGNTGATWNGPVNNAFGSATDTELIMAVQPLIQSVAAETAAKTGVLLGEDGSASTHAILTRSRKLASKVTGINETTRTRLEKTIQSGIDDGLSFDETVDMIRDRFPQIASNRIPTIARTEMGRAADEGMKETFRSSKIITHVSVIGCMAIEPGIPEYRGVPTCNIQNVPVQDVDLLEFHINHTGSIVPSGFREANGTVDPETLAGGEDGQNKPDTLEHT